MDSLKKKLKKIRHVIIDVDGVFTTGHIIVDGTGNESKMFHVHDGTAIFLLHRARIGVSLLSGRFSLSTEVRAKELKITDVHQGVHKKDRVFDEISEKFRIRSDEILVMGDDIIDIPILKKAGMAVVVSNAPGDIKQCADYVTTLPGGSGAMREVVELLLKEQNLWDKTIDEYFKNL